MTINPTTIAEPTFMVVLTHVRTSKRGAVRHHPDGCPDWADRHAAWRNPGQRAATRSEMLDLSPCLLCLRSNGQLRDSAPRV